MRLLVLLLGWLALTALPAAAFSRYGKGTLVNTPGGLKPIERLAVGDQVLSYRFPTGEVRPHTVVRIERRLEASAVELDLSGETVIVHPHLKVWSATRMTFKPVSDLVPGEILGMASWYWPGAIGADRFDRLDRRRVRFSGPHPHFRRGTPAGQARVNQVRPLEEPRALYGIHLNVADNILVGTGRMIFGR